MTTCRPKYYDEVDFVLDNGVENSVTLRSIAAYSVGTALLVGTGGALDFSEYKKWSEHLSSRVSFHLVETENMSDSILDTRQIEDHLANIKAVLKLSITDLADMFNVSRQAFYKWQSGETSPEEGNSEAIVNVSKIADKFRVAGVNRAGYMLKMKIYDNRSLIDLVKDGSFNMGDVNSLIEEHQRMKKSYKNSAIYRSTTSKHNDWMSDSSLPATKEY